MKRIIFYLTAAFFLASCSSGSGTETIVDPPCEYQDGEYELRGIAYTLDEGDGYTSESVNYFSESYSNPTPAIIELYPDPIFDPASEYLFRPEDGQYRDIPYSAFSFDREITMPRVTRYVIDGVPTDFLEYMGKVETGTTGYYSLEKKRVESRNSSQFTPLRVSSRKTAYVECVITRHNITVSYVAEFRSSVSYDVINVRGKWYGTQYYGSYISLSEEDME